MKLFALNSRFPVSKNEFQSWRHHQPIEFQWRVTGYTFGSGDRIDTRLRFPCLGTAMIYSLDMVDDVLNLSMPSLSLRVIENKFSLVVLGVS